MHTYIYIYIILHPLNRGSTDDRASGSVRGMSPCTNKDKF